MICPFAVLCIVVLCGVVVDRHRPLAEWRRPLPRLHRNPRTMLDHDNGGCRLHTDRVKLLVKHHNHVLSRRGTRRRRRRHRLLVGYCISRHVILGLNVRCTKRSRT